jgi:Mg-chelatase subunit ChlD
MGNRGVLRRVAAAAAIVTMCLARPAGGQNPKDSARKGPLDVIVVMDTTGSMQGSIDSLRANAIVAVTKLTETSSDIRLAVTTFRDLAEQRDLPHFEVQPLTRDLDAAFAFLNRLSADGGGDIPEDQLHGISLALELWEKEGETERVPTKIIIVVTDAPAKSPDARGNTFESIARRAFDVDPAHIYSIIVGNDVLALEHAARLAKDTGGKVLQAVSGDEVASAVLEAVADAAATYSPAPSPRSRTTWIRLIAGVLGGLGLVLLVAGLIVHARRKKKRDFAGTGLLVSGSLLLTAGVISLVLGLGDRRAGGDTRGGDTRGGDTRGGDTRAQIDAGSARPPSPPDATSRGRFADLLDRVPAEAFVVVAVDLEQARGSPGLIAALEALLRQSGLADRSGVLATGKRMVVAGIPRGTADPEPLLLVDDPGPELAGPSVLEAGALREAIAQGETAGTGFLAIHIPPEVRGDAAGMLGDLVTASWMVARFETGAGVGVTATARFADDATANRAAGALDLLRRLGAGQVAATAPAAAAALERLAVGAAGKDLQMTVVLEDAEIVALVALLQ